MLGSLPDTVTKYGETPVFDEHSVPAKLTDTHDTKAGVWGRLCVLSGSIRYVVDCGDPHSLVVNANDYAIIVPQQPHHVEIIGPAEFKVEFYREHEGE